MVRLGDYLTQERGKWDWISHDCSRWLDGWLVTCGWPSAMTATSIHYDGPVSAARVIRHGGGLLNLWSNGMSAIGLSEIKAPLKEGDVSILSIPTEDGTNETCGIWTGSKWASCHQRGLMFGIGEPLRAWSI